MVLGGSEVKPRLCRCATLNRSLESGAPENAQPLRSQALLQSGRQAVSRPLVSAGWAHLVRVK